jgi:replicative DNA helicase
LVSKRFDSIILDISTDTVFNDPNYVIKKLESYKEKNNLGKLYIKEYAPSTANMYMINRTIEKILEKYNSKIDVLVIDYATYLNPIINDNNLNSYERYKQVMKEMSSIAKERNIIVYTAGQINREGYKRKTARNFDFSDSIELPRISDWVITLNPINNNSDTFKYLKAHITKNREGIENISTFIKLDRQSLIISDTDESDNINDDEDDDLDFSWLEK